MEVSIVIVNYNVKQLILECIGSIYKYFKCVTFEIIIVDNNSRDDSINAIKTTYPEVIIIENKFNAGFSGATNQGMEIAKGDYIFLLNPDTYLIDESVCKLIGFIKEKKNNVLVAPRLLNNDRTLQYSAWKDKELFVILQESFQIYRSAYKLETFSSPRAVDNVMGAAMVFPKELIAKVGNFDSDIFWQDDFDFCYRVRKYGIPVVYYPDATIVHYFNQSAVKNVNVYYANLIISKLKLYRKHHSGFKVTLVVLLTLIHIMAYIIFLLMISPFSKHYRDKLIPYLYTFRKFIIFMFTGKISWA